MNRLFVDFCSGAPDRFLKSEKIPFSRRPLPPHWADLVEVLARQNAPENASPAAQSAIEVLRGGGGTVVTGQQVALFGGPLYTCFKAATALSRAQRASAAGHPHAAIFWLA